MELNCNLLQIHDHHPHHHHQSPLMLIRTIIMTVAAVDSFIAYYYPGHVHIVSPFLSISATVHLWFFRGSSVMLSMNRLKAISESMRIKCTALYRLHTLCPLEDFASSSSSASWGCSLLSLYNLKLYKFLSKRMKSLPVNLQILSLHRIPSMIIGFLTTTPLQFLLQQSQYPYCPLSINVRSL